MSPWLLLALVWLALVLPLGLLVGTALREAERQRVAAREANPDASWWELAR